MELKRVVVENNLVKYQKPDGKVLFAIAKDSMGTQICAHGRFFPDSNDFGSIENAQKYLNAHMEEAIAFFSREVPEVELGDAFLQMFSMILEHDISGDMDEQES